MNEALNEAGNSPAPAQGELVETIGISQPVADTEPEGANNTEAQTEAEEETGEQAELEVAEVKEPEKSKGDEFRFDKHPRFIELNARLKAAEEANREILERIAKQQVPVKEEAPSFKDWTKMTDEELVEWQASDPKGYLDNMKAFIDHQVQSRIEAFQTQSAQMAEKQSYEQKIQSTYESYAKENPDFDEMWDSGELKEFMDKNPGHNAISAHILLTAEAKRNAAIEKAVADALKKKEAEIKSKRAASKVVGAGPAVVPTPARESDERLKDPTKFGGKTNVLMQRLLERRKAVGG